MTLAIIIAKMIRVHFTAKIDLQMSPNSSIHFERICYGIAALSQKRKTCHSGYLHTKLSQYDNNSSVPACLRVQCTFSASVPVFHEYIRFRLHKNKLQQSKQRKSYLTCLRHCTTVKIPVKEKNMKANSQQSFLFRFKIQFKTVSTSYTVQVVSIDLQ